MVGTSCVGATHVNSVSDTQVAVTGIVPKWQSYVSEAATAMSVSAARLAVTFPVGGKKPEPKMEMVAVPVRSAYGGVTCENMGHTSCAVVLSAHVELHAPAQKKQPESRHVVQDVMSSHVVTVTLMLVLYGRLFVVSRM